MITRIRAVLFRGGERGLTLIELIVAIGVSSIIIVAVGGFFTASIRAAKTDSGAETNSRQASTIMNALTQYVHAATLLPQANGTYLPAISNITGTTDVTFYAYVNLSNGTVTQPMQVRFYVDPTTSMLMEQQWDGVLSTTNTGVYTFPTLSRTFTLGGPIASPTSDGTTLFTYLNAAGTAIVNPAGNIGSIRAIQVNLEVGSTKAGTGGDTHIQNTLYLFNVGYSTSTGTASAGS